VYHYASELWSAVRTMNEKGLGFWFMVRESGKLAQAVTEMAYWAGLFRFSREGLLGRDQFFKVQ